MQIQNTQSKVSEPNVIEEGSGKVIKDSFCDHIGNKIARFIMTMSLFSCTFGVALTVGCIWTTTLFKPNLQDKNIQGPALIFLAMTSGFLCGGLSCFPLGVMVYLQSRTRRIEPVHTTV